jgi:hypothetical protein
MVLLRELATSLSVREFTVRIEPANWSLVAKNELSADADTDGPPDPLARAFGPVRLTQRVQLATNDHGDLFWYWQWSGPDREAPPEYQPMCPAHAIAEATERISRVLALAGR